MTNFIVTCPLGHIMESDEDNASVLAIDLSDDPVFMRYYCETCGEWYEIEIKEKK